MEHRTEPGEATASAGGSVLSNGSGSHTVQATDDADADAGTDELPGACGALRQKLGARVSAGFAPMDTACQRDEECVFIGPSVGCYSACPSLVASWSGVQAAASAVLQDIAPLCSEFENQHCEKGPLTCNAGSPVLVCNGTCARVDQLSCDELLARAGTRVNTLLDDASRSCSRDSDCALTQVSLPCVPSCGSVRSVASSALGDLQLGLKRAAGLYCGSLESLRCPAQAQLPCAPPIDAPRAACNAGQCEVAYAPLP